MRALHPDPEPFHPARPGLVRPLEVSEKTGLTRRMARGPGWRRSSRGLFVPRNLPEADPLEQRIVEASVAGPPDGAVTGWAALRWLGGLYFDGRYGDEDLPIPLAVGHRHVAKRPGIAISWEFVLPREVIEVDGVRVTVPAYSAAFEARHARDGLDAVRALDMAMMFDLTDTEELVAIAVNRLFAHTGIAQFEAAICLSSENSWSPLEPTMRVLWETGLGLDGQLLANWPVFDLDGRHIGTPDLIDPAAGVVGEYDGAPHRDPAQRRRDVERTAAFRELGLQVVTMTVDDLPHGEGFLERLEACYFRAGRADQQQRAWSTALPAYWVPTHSVGLRRALTADQRDRFLGWQRRDGAGVPTPVSDVPANV